MADRPRKYADQLVDWLCEDGYTHCFFVAGGNIMHILDAVRTRLTCIPVVHEVSAGIAAEYFNETSTVGRAFALVTAGPGITNMITSISGAWLESRELLIIGGQVKRSDLSTNGVRQRGIQEIDGVALTSPVCKESIRITEPISKERFMNTVQKVSVGRPGPVFVEVCLDAQAAAPTLERTVSPARTAIEVPRSTEADRIAQLFSKAFRPVLLIGGGVSRRHSVYLNDMISRMGIPVMTTWNGADRVDSGLDSYLGRPNTWGQRAANLLMAQTDLIVAVGTRLGLQQTGFNWQEFGRNSRIVHVDIDSSELTKGHPKTDVKIQADANDFLLSFLPKLEGNWGEWVAYGKFVQSALPLNDVQNVTGPEFVDPYEFFDQLSELATTSDIIVPCSSGGANSVAMQTIRQKIGQTIITNKGLASMGYGLAGAIGASLADRSRRVFLIEGDGGFAQNLQELATVSVQNLPLKIFLFCNNGYGSIRATQRNYFGGAYLGCDIQTGLGFPGWVKLFESFGIRAVSIEEGWSQERSIRNCLESIEPHAFLVPIDPEQTYWPKITSRIEEDGSMTSNPLHKMTPDLSADILRMVGKYL